MANNTFSNYFKVITPTVAAATVQDNQHIDGSSCSVSNHSWYQRLLVGSATRLHRYMEYDVMDNDIDISRALDTIAEEMSNTNTNDESPLELDVIADDDTEIDYNSVLTLKTALKFWIKIHQLDTKLFKICRNTIKMGDCVFRKSGKNKQWEWITPANVVAAVVDEQDVTKIIGFQIKTDNKQVHGSPQSTKSNSQSHNSSGYQNMYATTEFVHINDLVRFTLNDDMSETAPFGESVLKTVYKTHKQKELLEDAVIIYRIQRAPERRVFYIDVGKMPQDKVKRYLEQVKNEMRQKRIPSHNNNGASMDSVYNPTSMLEDIFLAQRCLSLNTEIPLLDGRTITLNQIISEYEQGVKNWTYSVDQKTGKFIPGEIEWAGITRKNAELVRVELDNGEYIDCTPDHKFVLRDGTEVEAQYLENGVSLMPLISEVDINTITRCTINVTFLSYTEDTGCLTIKDPGENHNFAVGAGIYVKNSDSKGSKVDVLQGGQSTGETNDLEYFQKKVLRGLRVPIAWMNPGQEGALFNDGKLGAAYIEEQQFAKFVKRLQSNISATLDSEFKTYLKHNGIHIDNTLFRVKLPQPANFEIYRRAEMDSTLLSMFSNADNVAYLSKQFILQRYLQLSEEEIIQNEQLLKMEKGIMEDIPTNQVAHIIYGDAIASPGGDMGGFGGMGGEFGGASDMGVEPMAPEATPAALPATPGAAPGGVPTGELP